MVGMVLRYVERTGFKPGRPVGLADVAKRNTPRADLTQRQKALSTRISCSGLIYTDRIDSKIFHNWLITL